MVIINLTVIIHFFNHVAVSDLSSPLAEVLVLIQQGSHTPDSCVPLKYPQLYGMAPSPGGFQQKSHFGFTAFLSAFDQGCSMLLNNIFLIHK